MLPLAQFNAISVFKNFVLSSYPFNTTSIYLISLFSIFSGSSISAQDSLHVYIITIDGDTNTYETTVSANLGINGNVPIESYKHLQANAELQVGVKDSYTSIIVGLSYPLQ